ncbi:LacI family DNA-binding transcriptional regulator [Oleiagrimonas sp. C23AA]|uniref:LacI family DNA-binding transcriptional regulator n=1 Tax=Oleiagrimonas sp. C23AA TaxID=2719047 RepID=UPI001422EC3C|nr:LacI family DNA-binding transcriptional regulator [Oleiagrimonas sp. C23AA]NII09434.1 LacI family transcriptional regulator [Oleiagrimonas sp. C23AA]
MTVTIKDVAKAAGVSVASVSRALNGHQSVTEGTRRRVREAAERLKYIPHGAARSLITRRTHAVGALLPDLHGAFFSELIRGIDLAARAHGLHLLLSSSHGSAQEAAAALQSMRGRVDGLLVMSPHADDAFLRENLSPNLPSVLMNVRNGLGHQYTTLMPDNVGGARAMVEHLAACGHRRIAFIGGPAVNFDAQERLRGYMEGMASVLPDATALSLEGDFTEESGHRMGREALKLSPSAIFCANDMMAIGCLSAIREAGLSVPQDVALAGFDDIPMARYLTPPLTTVHVAIAELGSSALTQLAMAVESPDTYVVSEQTLPTELVIRDSCGFRATSVPSPRGRPAPAITTA